MTIEPIREKLDDKIAKLNSSRVYKRLHREVIYHGILNGQVV